MDFKKCKLLLTKTKSSIQKNQRLFGFGLNPEGHKKFNQRYHDLRRMKEAMEETMSPNHRRVIILGGGLAGVAAINQIKRLSGFQDQHLTMIEDKTFHHNPLGRELLSYGIMDEEDIEIPLLKAVHKDNPMSIDTGMT